MTLEIWGIFVVVVVVVVVVLKSQPGCSGPGVAGHIHIIVMHMTYFMVSPSQLTIIIPISTVCSCHVWHVIIKA